MRTVRVYSDTALAPGTSVLLGPDAGQHLARVLRMRVGDTVVLFDGTGMDYSGAIESIERNKVVVALGEARASASESPLRIQLWHGLCRGGRMDTVIQKATELGVTSVQPILTERGVVKLDRKRTESRLEHWRKVAIGAAEQSGRSTLPVIHPPLQLDAALAASELPATRLMPDPEASQGLTAGLLTSADCIVLTGPEGGFTEAERQLASAADFVLVSLGPRVMRTETAPLAALSILQFLGGDLGSA